MALVVEDGTIVAGANSYVTVTEYRAFAEDRGDTVVSETAEDEALEAALIKAADYMKQRLRMQWKGSRMDATQPMDWPRRGVDVPDFFDPFYRSVNVPVYFQDTYFIPENEVPQEVKDCQMLLANETLDSAGASTTSLQSSLGRSTRREKVGSLEVEYFGAGDGSDGGRLTQFYWNAMRAVEPFLLAAAPQTGRVVRS